MAEQSQEWHDAKLRVLKYRTLAAFHANTRLLLLILTLVSVIGAAFFAFIGMHKCDQFCAIVGLVTLALEAALFGIGHYLHWKAQAQAYTTLLDELDTGKPPAEVVRELGQAPEAWTWQRELSDWIAGLRWKKRKLSAVFAQLCWVLLLAFLIFAVAGTVVAIRAASER
jgi:hypothetical protein